MAVTNETLYIKGDKNVEVTKHEVTLGDLISMECSNSDVVNKLKILTVLKVPEKGEKRFVISILKVIELIHTVYPGIKIENMGEADMIITYENQETANRFTHVIKSIFILAITFFGSAFAIMTFDEDAGVSKIFQNIYELMMGYPPEGFTVIELGYCVGLIGGILLFFNYFGSKRLSVDPSPMEVEMRLYEDDLYTTLVSSASRKGNELDVS